MMNWFEDFLSKAKVEMSSSLVNILVIILIFVFIAASSLVWWLVIFLMQNVVAVRKRTQIHFKWLASRATHRSAHRLVGTVHDERGYPLPRIPRAYLQAW